MKYQNIISKQIDLHKGTNFFCTEENTFGFTKKLLQATKNTDNKNDISLDALIDNVVNNVLKEFYRVNQYYSFDEQAQNQLKNIYRVLYTDILDTQYNSRQLAQKHFKNLQMWLKNSNPFSEKIYAGKKGILKPVTCHEYGVLLQIDILQINLTEIQEPILDIGCGEKGNLVSHLRANGFEAFGIDRYPSGNLYIENIDWLEYNYGINKWGTIISNLGFSNHFTHHHLREDGNYIQYANKYMEILKSLKPEGSFHYAPDLPFIEEYLNPHQYQISRKELNVHNLKSTVIRRIK